MTSRNCNGYHLSCQNPTAKRVCVKHSFLGRGFLSVTLVAKNENVLMEIGLDGMQKPATHVYTATLQETLQKYCRIFQRLLQELPDYLEQGECDEKMKIDLILTNPATICVVTSNIRHQNLTCSLKMILLRWWRRLASIRSLEAMFIWTALQFNFWPGSKFFSLLRRASLLKTLRAKN